MSDSGHHVGEAVDSHLRLTRLLQHDLALGFLDHFFLTVRLQLDNVGFHINDFLDEIVEGFEVYFAFHFSFKLPVLC